MLQIRQGAHIAEFGLQNHPNKPLRTVEINREQYYHHNYYKRGSRKGRGAAPCSEDDFFFEESNRSSGSSFTQRNTRL
jgi:hypothetical protein